MWTLKLRRVVSCLLLAGLAGVGLTFAAEGAAVLWSPWPETEVSVDGGSWIDSVPDHWPERPHSTVRKSSIGLQMVKRYGTVRRSEAWFVRQYVVQAGFPWPAFYYRRNADFNGLAWRPEDWTPSSRAEGVELNLDPPGRDLPVLIRWPALLADIAVLGGAVLLLRSMWRWWRRRRAAARVHRCRACGYDLRGRPGHPCPECGTPPLEGPAGRMGNATREREK